MKLHCGNKVRFDEFVSLKTDALKLFFHFHQPPPQKKVHIKAFWGKNHYSILMFPVEMNGRQDAIIKLLSSLFYYKGVVGSNIEIIMLRIMQKESSRRSVMGH